MSYANFQKIVEDQTRENDDIERKGGKERKMRMRGENNR
jgi:hypothetical protein